MCNKVFAAQVWVLSSAMLSSTCSNIVADLSPALSCHSAFILDTFSQDCQQHSYFIFSNVTAALRVSQVLLISVIIFLLNLFPLVTAAVVSPYYCGLFILFCFVIALDFMFALISSSGNKIFTVCLCKSFKEWPSPIVLYFC